MENIEKVSIITTCKNRLAHLKQTLEPMQEQLFSEVIVVDYGCSQGTYEWVKNNFEDIKVIRVDDDPSWCASRARNIGASYATGKWYLFIDADIKLESDLTKWILENCTEGNFYTGQEVESLSLTGTFVCEAADFDSIDGYDEAFTGWGGEDLDIYMRLKLAGIREEKLIPPGYLSAIYHSDDLRSLGDSYQIKSREIAREVFTEYINEKINFYYKNKFFPLLNDRKKLMKEIKNRKAGELTTSEKEKLQDSSLKKDLNLQEQEAIARVTLLLSKVESRQKKYSNDSFPAGSYSLYLNNFKLEGRRDPDNLLKTIIEKIKGKRVLDIGCEQGGVLIYLRECIEWGVGLDPEVKLIESANILKESLKSKTINFEYFDYNRESHLISTDVFPDKKNPNLVLILSKNWKHDKRINILKWAASIGSDILIELEGSITSIKKEKDFLNSNYKEVSAISTSGLENKITGRRTRILYCQQALSAQ